MKEILDDIERWRAAGKRVAMARVVDIDGSGPRLPGAAMAVSEDGEVAGSLTFFAYEDAFEPELLNPFEEANPDVEVRTAAFANADETVTKLQGGFQADVINVCVEDTERMVSLGLLEPIDTSRIAPECASVLRRIRASTANSCGSPSPPYRTPGTRPVRRRRRAERDPSAAREVRIRYSDSGVVIKISGGLRESCRRWAGSVSPLRTPMIETSRS